jgi:phosphoglycerate dehydrogenase-like enzyme
MSINRQMLGIENIIGRDLMKVVIARLLSEEFLTELRTEFPDVNFEAVSTPEEQSHHIKDADVLFGYPSRDDFLAAERLQWIQCPGTGVDRIVAIPEVVESDVVLTNARGPHVNPMADHAFFMILDFAHRGRQFRDDQRLHRWDTQKYEEQMIELSGQTLGILALGDLGNAVARRAHAFEMEVYAVDVRSIPAPQGVKEVWGPERLDELLQLSDWFVVTAPFTPQTEGLIDRRRIELIKPGAYLIVISRGGIVDEAALVDALRSGRIAGAGLDALAEEPLLPDNPLWDMENVIITPHASALAPKMWGGRKQIFIENLRRFLAGEPFIYVCDKRAGF